MTTVESTAPTTPVFDPEKLEQLNVSKDYPMEPDEFALLFEHNCYCDMAHVNKHGFPIVTPMFYVVIDGLIHMSSIQKHRAKVHHLERDSRISVSIHNDGAELRHQKSILVVGHAEVVYGEDIKKAVHWKLIDKYWRQLKDDKIRQTAFEAVHTPMRAILKVNPTKVISWDFGKMVQAYERGVWFNEAYDIVRDLQDTLK